MNSGLSCAWMVGLALAASGCCDRRGCEAISDVVVDVGITQGIAGAAAFSSDVPEVCNACPLTDVEILIVRADALVDDNEGAQAVVDSDAERLTVRTESGRYEVELSVGGYVVCAPEMNSCAFVDVGVDEVRTVHISETFTLTPIVPFGRDGTRGGPNFFVRFDDA